MSFILQAFSIRDERVISAGLAREWYIVLAMDETKSKHKEDQAPGTAPESNNPSQPKGVFARIKAPFNAAFPVMIGYVFLGIPCGILAQQIGLDPLQVFLLSMLFYSGAGQYMIPNMWLAGSPALAIIASVTLVNTRQLLYGASLSRFCHETPKPLSFLFGATARGSGGCRRRRQSISCAKQHGLLPTLLALSSGLFLRCPRLWRRLP